MTIRIPWDRYEVALLFSAYERVAGGSNINIEATKLSEALRNLATRRGASIDETYRNVNGMKMQLANVQYLFTDGGKGLSGASAMIRQTYTLYKSAQAEYQTILKEAIRMTGTTTMSIEGAFFAYAKDKTSLPPKILANFLKKTEDYCHLKQPLLGMKDVKAVRNVQQKVSEEQLLRFRFGKDAQTIRNVTQLYYTFIKSYREPKEEPAAQEIPLAEKAVAEQALPAAEETIVEIVSSASPADDHWLSILQNSFPDGYILNDFLSQFQAGAFWQEHYDEACPIEGIAIDEAMKAIGTVRDGRVFAKSEEDRQLISAICAEINDILSHFTTVYRISIFEHYQERLARSQIYTEQVMTQQLLDVAKESFYSVNQVFAKRGQYASVIQDCRKVLRNHGGAMPVSDVAKELWFIPYDMVYHYLSVDDEALNIGNSVWMLAEHFPLTREDAAKVGDMLDEYFLSQDFGQAMDLMPLMKQRLPSIADNLSGLHFTAIFNILNYHLKDRFSFSRAIIAPKGAKTDFRDLFRGFAKEHECFTLDELAAFASELHIPIYWENTFIGGAVRVSRTEFVHRSQITFDTEATDAVLESFCTGDYLPLQAVSSALMMHLPQCGYRWNGYLLLSYVHGFSKVFLLSYKSLGMTGYCGAMVRRSCKKIDCYERLIEQVLTDDNTWHTEGEALDLLVSKGLQVQKRLKEIEQIVAKARQNKLSDDGR